MMQRNIYLGRASVWLWVFSLVGCASHASMSNQAVVHAAMQPPIRIILYFQHPASENKSLSSAIAEACFCQPVFIRSYSSDALIYEIALPQERSFAMFEKALMQHSVQFGIRLIEQDSIMQHQQRSGNNAQVPVKVLMPDAK